MPPSMCVRLHFRVNSIPLVMLPHSLQGLFARPLPSLHPVSHLLRSPRTRSHEKSQVRLMFPSVGFRCLFWVFSALVFHCLFGVFWSRYDSVMQTVFDKLFPQYLEEDLKLRDSLSLSSSLESPPAAIVSASNVSTNASNASNASSVSSLNTPKAKEEITIELLPAERWCWTRTSSLFGCGKCGEAVGVRLKDHSECRERTVMKR